MPRVLVALLAAGLALTIDAGPWVTAAERRGLNMPARPRTHFNGQPEGQPSPPEPAGPVETLAEGDFAGQRWYLMVFKARDESGGEWTCMDFDGVDNETAWICTQLPLGEASDDIIGASFAFVNEQGAWLAIKTVVKQAASVTLESEGGESQPIELLTADRVETPHNYIVVVVPSNFLGYVVARDSSGNVLERERVSGNDDR
jgi:hypothetical protein